jgi:hypothetical protein
LAERICSVHGCNKKHHGRGLCKSHHAKARREGKLPVATLPTDPAVPHSLSNIDREGRVADCVVCGPGAPVRFRADKRRPVECLGARRFRGFRSRYGLSRSELGSLLRLRMHESRCAICGKECDKLVVGHCHVTGKIRGLLCSPCNLGLELFGDDSVALTAAAAYLQAHAPIDGSTA